jgi:chromosome partitioning protein
MAGSMSQQVRPGVKREAHMSLPRVIAIGSKKGGVAKTTTCLSLGASLAQRGRRVLLVDLDSEAHLTLSLGLNPREVRSTLGDVFLSKAKLGEVIRRSEVSRLELVPANPAMDAVDKFLYGQSGYEYHLKTHLDAPEIASYDLVLMDCPPSSGAMTINALTAARLLIIPTQCEFYAGRSLRNTLELIKQVRQRTNPRLAYRVLITLFDRRNRISHIILDQLESAFAGAMFETVIEIDTRLRESPTFGLPITDYAPSTRGAQQYRALAQELMDHA